MSKVSRTVIGLFGWLFSLGFAATIVGLAVGFAMFNHYAKDLPDYSQLSKYDPETVTRLYAADGRLMAEYATEKRVFVPLKAIPRPVIDAFLSAEDKNFYGHTGIDFTGLARALRDNINNYGQGKSLVGGSTITQQVVKNFLLTNEKSLERKIKEAILAMRISQVYSKDKILELYLNEIYLGLGSYGVAAAAQNYFNKSLDELTVEEAALLATQPKGPSLYNPRRSYDAAKERRDWVIERMREDGRINDEQALQAMTAPITLRERDSAEIAKADFFAEEVRRRLAEMYGSNVLYQGGLVVKTTLDPVLQKAADDSLRAALIAYDRRRGYRGPIARIPSGGDRVKALAALVKEHGYQLLEGQKLAVVVGLDDRRADIMMDDGARATLPFALMKWTRRIIADGQLGPEVRRPADILAIGDVVLVNPLSADEKKQFDVLEQKKAWSLAQIPEVNGAMVVMDPHTGRVLALSGGYAYGGTEFNRATQARRQPGSAFKPFVYTAALENGFNPSSIVLDAPVEMSQGAGQAVWRPANFKNEYLGPTTLRVGLEKSRNTMTVRLAQMMGIEKALEIGKRFGIYDEPPRNFSIVLGTAETTLLRLANAYGMLANGGKRITPSLIERIDDRHGKIIYRRDNRECAGCTMSRLADVGPDLSPPVLPDMREVVMDPRVNYQIVSILQGVATRGTAARSKEIGKIVAGKTGTTNDSLDTWFVGFSPDLVAGVFVGYDRPRTLGKKETGSSVALPAFISFMKTALADVPNKPFRVPRGISLTRVDLKSGLPASEVGDGGRVIEEAFVVGGPIYIPGVSPADALDSAEQGTQIGAAPDVQGNIIIDPPETESRPVLINPQPEEELPAAGSSGLY
jgi:penicillin-binding protein 1A